MRRNMRRNGGEWRILASRDSTWDSRSKRGSATYAASSLDEAIGGALSLASDSGEFSWATIANPLGLPVALVVDGCWADLKKVALRLLVADGYALDLSRFDYDPRDLAARDLGVAAAEAGLDFTNSLRRKAVHPEAANESVPSADEYALPHPWISLAVLDIMDSPERALCMFGSLRTAHRGRHGFDIEPDGKVSSVRLRPMTPYGEYEALDVSPMSTQATCTTPFLPISSREVAGVWAQVVAWAAPGFGQFKVTDE